MMNPRLRFLLPAVAGAWLLLALPACDDGARIVSPDPALSTSTTATGGWGQGHYPLQAGWTWKYYRRFTVYDTGGHLQYLTRDTSWVSATGPVDLDGIEAQELHVRTVDGDGQVVYEGSVYYTQDRDALIEVGYEGTTPVVTPAPRPVDDGTGYYVGGRTFRSLEELDDAFRAGGPFGSGWSPASTSVLRDEPRIVLSYPLTPGKTWVAFTDPWVQTRTVVRRELALGPYGQWGAARIETQGLEGVRFTDWVAPVGLVRRLVDTYFDGGAAYEFLVLLSASRGHPKDSGPGNAREDFTLPPGS